MFILLQVAWFHIIYPMVILKVWQNEKNYPIRKRKGIAVLIQWMTTVEISNQFKIFFKQMPIITESLFLPSYLPYLFPYFLSFFLPFSPVPVVPLSLSPPIPSFLIPSFYQDSHHLRISSRVFLWLEKRALNLKSQRTSDLNLKASWLQTTLHGHLILMSILGDYPCLTEMELILKEVK